MSRQDPLEPRLPGWDAVDEPGQVREQGRSPGPGAVRDGGEADRVAGGRGRAPAPPGTFGLRVRSVSEVSRAIREHVRADDGLRDLWVEGEVGRVTVSAAGHAYFTLKDARAQLQCVWFRDDRARSPFQPQTGLQVVAHGRVDLFEPQGALQLYVDSLQPWGFGDLAIRFEQLKARLAAEGLFESTRKQPLPARPRAIAVITSPSGAVWRDVCNVLARRWPLTRVVLVACQVQGEGSPTSIVAAFRRLERWLASLDGAAGEAGAVSGPKAGAGEGHARAGDAAVQNRAGDVAVPELTILARGGGSLEDLWSFNDERVVRAIAAHSLPVVCGVGHETDVTLADFVADMRAPTPSAAAELVVPDRAEIAAVVAGLGSRGGAAIAASVGAAGRGLATERRLLDRLEPRAQLASSRERAGLLLDRAARAVTDRLVAARTGQERLGTRMAPLVEARLSSIRGGLAASTASLVALAPEATLRRGYAIARRAADGTILRDPTDAPAGTPLDVTLWRGTLSATSEGPRSSDEPGGS